MLKFRCLSMFITLNFIKFLSNAYKTRIKRINFALKNALKLTYGNVEIQKILRSLYPRIPAYRGQERKVGGEERWRTGRKGEERRGIGVEGREKREEEGRGRKDRGEGGEDSNWPPHSEILDPPLRSLYRL
jgi:hypothetical protein